MCGVCCKHKSADCLQTSLTFVPSLLLKKLGLWAGQGQQPGLQLGCAASPSPLTLGGALHQHKLVQTGVGGGWTSTQQEPQWGRCHFQTSRSILQIVKIDLSSDYLVVNDIWHFYHGLIILLLLYNFFLITREKV